MGEINYKNCPVCESDKNKIHSVQSISGRHIGFSDMPGTVHTRGADSGAGIAILVNCILHPDCEIISRTGIIDDGDGVVGAVADREGERGPVAQTLIQSAAAVGLHVVAGTASARVARQGEVVCAENQFVAEREGSAHWGITAEGFGIASWNLEIVIVGTNDRLRNTAIIVDSGSIIAAQGESGIRAYIKGG